MPANHIRRRSVKLPTDPPKAIMNPESPDRAAQREYNVRRRNAKTDFAAWFQKKEGSLPEGLQAEVDIGNKIKDLEYQLEVAKSNLQTLLERRQRYDAQETAWLAAHGIAPNWLQQLRDQGKL